MNKLVAAIAGPGPDPAPEAPLSRHQLVRICAALYIVLLGAYAGASGKRILQRSNDNHYVHLAYGWLHGRLDLGGPPPHMNDWAQVEWLHLKDGQLLKGAFAQGSTETFRTLDRRIVTVAPASIDRKETKYYVSFPPFPAVAMLPVVAVAGMRTNDVLFTVLLAPLGPILLFVLLRRLRARGDTRRSVEEDLLLTLVFAVGSVYYFSSVRGEVWYTAHVTSVIAVVSYALFALDARRPMLAGLALACGFLSRPEILFAAPLFLLELARVKSAPAPAEGPPDATDPSSEPAGPLARLGAAWGRIDKQAALRALVAFGLPIALLGTGAGVLNLLRFGRFTEFGHTYLNVIQASQIQKYGLFNLVYLGRNLACAFALTPTLVAGAPWIKISWHGQAMWVTTPVLLPPGDLHDQLVALTGGAALYPTLTIMTTRQIMHALRDATPALEIALDVVTFLAGGRESGCAELEIELREAGSLEDLALLSQLLTARFPLSPEPRSKLARGLALLEATE